MLLIYLVRKDVIETVAKIDDISWWILLLMIPVQALNFQTYALMYDDLLRFLGHKISISKLYRITLELNFVNHVFPSGGVSGFSYFSLRLRTLGENRHVNSNTANEICVSFCIVSGSFGNWGSGFGVLWGG